MESYYIKATITTVIEVIDCETLEGAKKHTEAIVKDAVKLDFFRTELEEV